MKGTTTTSSALLVLAFLIVVLSSLSAQEVGDNRFGLGYSVGEGQGVSVFGQRMLEEVGSGVLAVGGIFNLRGQRLDGGDQTLAVIGARVSYHPDLIKNDRFDPYGVAMLGVGFESIDNDSSYMGPRQEIEEDNTAWGVALGMHFRIFNFLGAFAEVGVGTGYATVGLSLIR